MPLIRVTTTKLKITCEAINMKRGSLIALGLLNFIVSLAIAVGLGYGSFVITLFGAFAPQLNGNGSFVILAAFSIGTLLVATIVALVGCLKIPKVQSKVQLHLIIAAMVIYFISLGLQITAACVTGLFDGAVAAVVLCTIIPIILTAGMIVNVSK